MSPKDSISAVPDLSFPKAKNIEIVVQELESEMLVYDLGNDKAHHLNETVSLVWKNCDGKTTPKEVAKRLEKQFNTKIEEDFVWLALDELEKANLLEAKLPKDDFTKLSRRKVLFRYAPLAAAIPIVMSLVAPQAAHAQSCIALNQPCSAPAQCCSGTCEGAPGQCM